MIFNAALLADRLAKFGGSAAGGGRFFRERAAFGDAARSIPLGLVVKMKRSLAAFTLLELLVVVAIMAVLAAVGMVSVTGVGSSRKFDQTLSQITGIFEQARSYAIGQNTYVWVALYPVDASKLASQADMSGDHLIVATYASNDGTDPIQWVANANGYAIPYSSPGDTVINLITKVQTFTQIRMAPGISGTAGSGIPYLAFPSGVLPPEMTGTGGQPMPASPASNILFKYPLASAGGITLSNQPVPAAAQPISVIEFTPSGSAQVAPGLSAAIRIDFAPMKTSAIVNNTNIASVEIGGLIGLVTLYRP